MGIDGWTTSLRGGRIMLCTRDTVTFPFRITLRSVACFIDLVRPSARLSALRKSPMSDKSYLRNSSRAAAMSSISRFSDVRYPFEMTSNRRLESVRSCSGMWRLSKWLISSLSVTAASLIFANAITSPAIAERVMRRDLYDLNTNSTLLLSPSTSRTMYPSSVERSQLLAKDASEKPTTRSDFSSSFGVAMGTRWVTAYRTARLRHFMHSLRSELKCPALLARASLSRRRRLDGCLLSIPASFS